MADILENIAKIYLNADHTEKKKINPFIGRGANGTYLICMVGPFNNQDSHYVNFGLSNKIAIDPRYMTLIGIENSEDTNNEDWYVWLYEVGGKILAGAAAETTSILNITFSQFANSTIGGDFEFLGFQSSEVELNVNFPTPSDDEYMGVGEGTTLGTSIAYLAVAGSWVNQNQTVLEFESANDILRETKVIESPPISLTVESNISTVIDEEDNTNLDVVFKNISTLNGKVLDIETLLGTNGENFVKSDLFTEYTPGTSPDSNSVLYYQEAGSGDPKRITIANLLESGRAVFIGTFETASGLTCPDPDDLLCEWPNAIPDPSVRRGWIANVNSTATVWAWSEVTNQWVDTNQAQADMSNSFYDSTSDPISSANNGQDMGIDHANAIKENQDKVLVVENKTQKLNTDGDIAENIEVIPGKDISSTDLSTITGIGGIIANILSHFTRIGDNETNISTNIDDILTKLQKDFSTLGSVVLEGSDLFVIRDDTDGLNKKVSLNELASKIEGLISNDQGWYTSISALKSAIPVGEDGWFATLGDTDTMGIWDSDTADWVEVASKLYYTLAAGLALETRVTAAELAIIANAEAIVLKFDIANLTSDIDGNSTSETNATTPKGVFDKVKVTDDKTNENRTYSVFIQTNNFISRVASEITLFKGREERMLLDGGFQVAVGIAQLSIDGGQVYKNIAIYIPGAGWVDADLSLGLFFGERFLFIFDDVRDKWLAFLSDEIISRALGATFQAFMSIGGNYDAGQVRDSRLANLEENQGVPALQEVAINAPVVVTTNTIAHELVFNEATIPSNEPTILDVDGNFNHVIKSNTEPGLSFDFYAQIKNQGTPGSNATAVFYVANKSAPCNAGTFVIGKKYIINAVGTTDFTAIGASANTEGVVFIATGVGTGTGSALCIFRDIRITAIGQDEENDRGIPLKISNNDYVAPFTPGVYYTKEGVDYNILQTIFTCDTIFPSGNAPASTETTILIDSATESRNGLKTKQKGHNEESVVDRKDLLETQKLVVANYQSVGQYLANKPEIVLTTNKIVRVLFNGQGTDLSELVELSLDNGSTYYDVEYRETDVDLTVENAIKHVMDLYFTGAIFIATYVDSAIVNDTIPYNGKNGQFENPLAGVPIVIGEETSEEVKDVRGKTLSQLNINGDKETNLVITATGQRISLKLDGTIYASTGYTVAEQTYDLIAGNTYFASFKSNDGLGLLRDSITIAYSDVTFVFEGPATDNFNNVSIIFTATKSLKANIKFAGTLVNSGTLIRVNQMLHPVPAGITTVEEMEKLLTGEYFEGTVNAGQAKTEIQLLDNRDKMSTYTLTGNTVIENDVVDGLSYAKFVANGVDNRLIQSGLDLEVSSVYTAIIHVPDNSLDIQGIVVGGTSGDDFVETHVIVPGDKGVFKFLMTTNATLVNGSTFIIINSVTNVTGEAHLRPVLVKGNHINISDEEALRIVKDVANGAFTRQGITYKIVGNNKIDLLEQGSLGSGDGLEIPATARLRTPDYISVIGGKEYIVKAYNQKDATVLNVIVMQYDSELNFLLTSGWKGNPYFLTLETNTCYVKTLVKFITDADIEVEDILEQLELGIVATIYETYKDSFSWVDTGEDGFAMLPNGVYDDELKQRISNKYTLVEDDITALNILTNIQEVRTRAFVDGTDLGVPVSEYIVEGYSPASSPFDDIVNYNKYARASVSGNEIKYAFPLGTFASLAEAKTFMAGIKLQYQLIKELDRTEANDNQVPIYGELFIGPRHTYEVSVPQGVLPSRWSATSSINTKGQIKANTDSIVRLAKKLATQGLSIEEITVELNKLADEIGYTPDLLTTAKVVVDAINELLLDLAATDDDIITIKGAGWSVETIKANNTLILALQAKSVVAFTGSASITDSTSLPASNITLSVNVSDYDYMILLVQDSSMNYYSKHIDLNTGATKLVVLDDDVSTGIKYTFRVNKETETTLRTYFAKIQTTTFGSPANIVEANRVGMTVEMVILGNF